MIIISIGKHHKVPHGGGMEIDMKIYDISQEVFSCEVYPGDDSPKMQDVHRTERGDTYNLTNFSMCAHNGTHIDAPFHFFGDGKTVDKVPLFKFVGACYVAEASGEMTEAQVKEIINRAEQTDPESAKRILLKGKSDITESIARMLKDAEIYLVGVESQTAGDIPSHKILLGAEVVLLEGLRLDGVPEGVYLLNCAPLNLAGSDGAPCRAILMKN